MESWNKDLCSRNHRSSEKIRRKHIWRGLPSFKTLHCKCRSWCFGQSFCLKNSSQWKIIIFRSEIWKESRNLPRYSRVPKWIIMLWWWKNELIKITKKKKEHCFPCEKLQQPNSYLQQQQYTLYIKWLPKKTFLKRILKSALSPTSI